MHLGYYWLTIEPPLCLLLEGAKHGRYTETKSISRQLSCTDWQLPGHFTLGIRPRWTHQSPSRVNIWVVAVTNLLH